LDSSRNYLVSLSTVRAFRDGDEKAFEEIFHQFADRVYQFVRYYHISEVEAQEITQEVFVKLWESRSGVDAEANFNAYIFTIARNIVFNNHKKKVHEWKYVAHLRNHIRKDPNLTEQTVYLDELSDLLAEQINKMPEKRRLVFELSRIKGLTHKEISQQLDISVKTIEVHIRLALKELRIALKDYYLVILLICWNPFV
jgi:RNA polymerase sigma-70 factor (ECF subfamily)